MTIKIDKVTGLSVVEKQPSESILFDMPLKNRMRGGDTISGFVATYPKATNLGIVNGSANVTIASSAYSDTTVQVRVGGGTDQEHYKITVRVNTVGGDIVEADGILYVTDN